MLKGRFFYLNLIFWIGFTSLIYEIYSTRVIFLFFLETNQAITIAISSFLAGLAFSSLIFSHFSKNSNKKNLLLVFLMQLAVAAYGYLVLRHFEMIPQTIDFVVKNISHQGWSNLLKMAIIWIYLFIPAFFIGGSFPLINGLYLESKEKGTQDTGMVYFWDTFGSILGAFAAGFWMLPYLGFRLTCAIVVLLNIFIAIVIAPKKEWRAILFIVASLISLNEINFFKNSSHSLPSPIQGATIQQPTTTPSFPQHPPTGGGGSSSPKPNATKSELLMPEFPQLDGMFSHILFQEVSPFGKITIGENGLGDSADKVLFVNYRDVCHSQSHDSESKIGSLATSNLPDNSHVLNIGLGCGFTADAMNRQSKVSKLDIAEINPVVVKGTSQFFTKENGDVLNSSKTTLFVKDGAELIRNTQTKYNAIVIDIEEVSVIYSSPLYTKEYFALSKNKMSSDGVLALWAHRGGNEFEKIIYNTLKSVFNNLQ